MAWLVLCPSVVHADDGDPSKTSVPEPRAADLAISAEQVTAFVDLVNEPSAEVLRRLQLDADLMSSAVAAADARLSRKRSGKIHATVGFGIVAVGAIAGYFLIASSFDREGNGYNVAGDRIGLGTMVIAATAGFGLGLGIPGIVKMVKKNEVEKAAADRYQRSRLPSPPIANGAIYSGPPARYAIHLPLVAFSF